MLPVVIGALLLLAFVAGVLWMAGWPASEAAKPVAQAAQDATQVAADARAETPASPARPALAPSVAPVAMPSAEPQGARARSADGGTVDFGKLNALHNTVEVARRLAANAKNADEYVDRFCEQVRRLHEKPGMPDPTGNERDAAEFMAPRTDYEAPLDKPPGSLHLNDELRARLNGYGADSMLKITEQDVQGLDFTWMTQLLAFDHWTLLTAGKLKDWSFEDWFNSPIPNYSTLSWYAKMRFAMALRHGDLLQASREVRHLADLERTQGIVIGEMVAIATYGVDQRARELAAAAGKDVTGWPVIEQDTLRLQRQMSFGSFYFAYPGVKPETVRKVAGCMPAPCEALNEAAGANKVLGAYAETNNLDLIGELAKAKGCEQAVLDRARTAKELTSGEALDELLDDLDQQIPQRVTPH
ncbi:MAG: hypothetical protein JST92_16030 [Deltaproteobacteria bacterium]|nr:hypothetical protein [Deltaproteobacteria bacterium]